MGKNRRSSRVVSFIRFPPVEIERLKNDFFNKLNDLFVDETKKEIQIMTQIISNSSYNCPKCGMTKVPKTDIIPKSNDLYHKITSSISGGGTRFCGPVKEEIKP